MSAIQLVDPYERMLARSYLVSGPLSTPCRIAGRSGYPTIRVDGVQIGGHRLTWIRERGAIPKGMCVLHHCDDKRCCEIEHLWLGTKADNTRDAKRKGRLRGGGLQGEAHGRAKLTEEQVLAIRVEWESGRRQTDIAADFGVHRRTVGFIVRRATWRHLGE